MSINILGSIVAAILSMGLGFVWYSKTLFGKRWMAEMGISESDRKEGNMTKQLVGGVIGQLVIALIFSFMMGLVGVFSIGQAFSLAFWLWLGFMAPILLGSVLWEKRSPTFFLINASYWLVSLLLIGLILMVV